jgi:hypothetical protein
MNPLPVGKDIIDALLPAIVNRDVATLLFKRLKKSR